MHEILEVGNPCFIRYCELYLILCWKFLVFYLRSSSFFFSHREWTGNILISRVLLLNFVRQDQSGIESRACCFLVAKLCLTLCDTMDCSTPGFPVLHYLLEFVQTHWASLVVRMAKNPSAMRETWVWSLSWEDPLEESMTTHSSILAWRIPMDRGA